MIKLFNIFIAGLDRKVGAAIKGTPQTTIKIDSSQAARFRKAAEKQAAANEQRWIESSYKRMEQDVSRYRAKAPASVPTGKGLVHNLWNIAVNAIDNTVGYGIAKYQNYRTRRELRKDPESKKQIVYLMHGVMQNKGSQWRLARDLKKKGYAAYHLKVDHSLTRKDGADRAFGQVKELHDYTGIKNAEKRKDLLTGHSSGADLGIFMASDPRIKEYGISRVQARAPAPYGIKPATFGQKLLMPIATQDDLRKLGPKRNAVEMYGRKPIVPVDVVAGTYDKLVRPRDAAYKHADRHYILTGPNSTHFATCGIGGIEKKAKEGDKMDIVNINPILIELMTNKGQ